MNSTIIIPAMLKIVLGTALCLKYSDPSMNKAWVKANNPAMDQNTFKTVDSNIPLLLIVVVFWNKSQLTGICIFNIK